MDNRQNSTGKRPKSGAKKTGLHPRNRHKGKYDFDLLIQAHPDLDNHVAENDYGNLSINFFDPEAVKALNTALLKSQYDVEYWDIPENYLCPPIPGRADYIHHMADVLESNNPPFLSNEIPRGSKIRCLDIGVGANCVYPIIGNHDYGWSFVGSEVEPAAFRSAQNIIDSNPQLKDTVELRYQTKSEHTFNGIIKKGERFDLTICNPPFHASAEEAHAGTLRKLRNLKQTKVKNAVKNFGGKSNELWFEGREEAFVNNLITESKDWAWTCYWFSTMISKHSNLKAAYRKLREVGAEEVKTIPMGQGNKTSRLIAWTFLTRQQQNKWIKSRWM